MATFKRIAVIANAQVDGSLTVIGVPVKGEVKEYDRDAWLWSTRWSSSQPVPAGRPTYGRSVIISVIENEFSPRARRWDKRTRGYKVLLKAIKYIQDIEALGFDAFHECTVCQELWSEDL